jgi:hypothetical protein
MKNVPKEVLMSGADVVNETLKYSCATAEYTGLVSISYVRRGGGFFYDPLSKAAEPVCDLAVNAYKKTTDGISWIYDRASSGLGQMVKAIPLPGKRMRNIEERLLKIEEWMAYIEKHGLVMAGVDAKGRTKKLSEEKEALLKTILLDNIELKDLA